MTMHEFVRLCGSQDNAADRLGTNRQQIGRWLKLGAIVVDGKLYAPIKRLNTKEQFEVQNEK